METPSEGGMRKCTKCNTLKPLSEYLPYRIKSNGRISRQFRCRDCYNKYNREWRAKEGNRYRDLQKKRWHDRLKAMTDEERIEHNKKMATKTRQRNLDMKNEVFNAYGGYVCACCGETEKMFLTIDHINNDGAEHRKKINMKQGGTIIHRWLIQNGFPKGFQVLCWNCQWGKVKNNGVCPHQATRNDYPVKGVESSDSKRSAPQVGDEIVYSAKETCSSREAGRK